MLLNCGHYSENKNGDEQNKNRWGLLGIGLTEPYLSRLSRGGE